MGGDYLTIRKFHIGKKALITPQQAAFDERGRQFHPLSQREIFLVMCYKGRVFSTATLFRNMYLMLTNIYRHCLVLLFLLLSIFLSAPTCRASAEENQELDTERGRKVFLTNLGLAAGVITIGTLSWDYFRTSPKASSEGWFDRDAPEAGMDKLGHLYISYGLTDGLTSLYTTWGYTPQRAAELGALSSLGVMSLMEVGDSFSGKYGFSWEDMTMNVAGVTLGYLLNSHPELRRKFAYRVEYWPEFGDDFEADFFTDYQHHKFLLAIKADGFDFIRNKYLQYLELQVGYYARDPEDWERTLYAGIGLNLGKLFHRWTQKPVFDYLQLPYTYLPLKRDLDR